MSAVDNLADRLREDAAHAQRLEQGAAPGAFARRPAPGKWSAAECVEHLNLTSRAYLPRLQAAYAELRARGLTSDGPYRMEWTARLLGWLLEPPARLRMPAPAPFQPAPAGSVARTVPDFVALQGRLLELLEGGRGLALDRARVASPFAERIRYTVYAAWVLIEVHQRRHLWQAERALG